MNDQAWKMAVDGLESAIASREVDLERLKMQRDAMRWREKASVEIERPTAERNEARAEVERLTKERDEAKTLAESYRKQGEADWNACCDVLIWARRFAKDLPPPSRAVTAVLELLQKTQQERDTARGQAHEAILVNKALFDGDSIPASHAEKVLVDVAKAAARIGAEEMREKALGAVAELRARWNRYRDAPLSSDDGSWTARWDAAYSLSEDIERNIKVIPPTGDEP